jgi:hypothetical protein
MTKLLLSVLLIAILQGCAGSIEPIPFGCDLDCVREAHKPVWF